MSSFDDLLGDEPTQQTESSREIKIEPEKPAEMPVEQELVEVSEEKPVKKKRASTKKEKPVEPALIAGRWERSVAIRKINEARVLPGMIERLGDSMKLPTPLQLIKKTDAELDEIINEMECHLSSRNGLASIVKNTVLPGLLQGYEGTLKYLGVPVDGVAAVLMSDPEFMSDIEELVWKRISYSNWPPEIRVLISIAVATGKQVMTNKVVNTANAEIDVVELLEKYPDL